MSCKLSDKCDNVFACNVLRPNVELLGCNFYKPKKPQTNEEWIKQANTEQLAEWIFKICERATWDYKVKIMVGEKKKELIMEWLKQPHKDGES